MFPSFDVSSNFTTGCNPLSSGFLKFSRRNFPWPRSGDFFHCPVEQGGDVFHGLDGCAFVFGHARDIKQGLAFGAVDNGVSVGIDDVGDCAGGKISDPVHQFSLCGHVCVPLSDDALLYNTL